MSFSATDIATAGKMHYFHQQPQQLLFYKKRLPLQNVYHVYPKVFATPTYYNRI
mgnify:CR=1 FL=1